MADKRRVRPSQARFTADAEVVTVDPLIEGDSGEQLALLAPPSQTGEGLALDTAGPLFGKGEAR